MFNISDNINNSSVITIDLKIVKQADYLLSFTPDPGITSLIVANKKNIKIK